MPRKISDIYTEYKIMPSLQEHMLRVAAVASLICENFSESLPKEEIITACLLHDMGNIIKFRMDVLPEFLEPEGLEYWQKVQDEYKEKYGESEHKATTQIIKEINVTEDIIHIINQIDFSLLCHQRDSHDVSSKIVIYSDDRVDPRGIVSFDERMEEGKRRYRNHKSTFGSVSEEERQRLVVCGQEIEKQIFAKCKIKPENIDDKSVAPIIEKLRGFVI